MNIFKLTLQFAKEAGVYIAKGMPNVSPEEYEARLQTCQACPLKIQLKGTSTNQCSACGCVIETKAKWATSDCPKKKWAKQKKK
jgi:hypothetical protein